mgnify:CR=1 FL=1
MTKLHADRCSWLTAVILCLLVTAGAGCATTSLIRNGQRAEQLQDYDLAVVEYTKALQKDPDNRELRQVLERAKLRGAQAHYTRGRRLANVAKVDEALIEFQLAADLNPGSSEIADALRDTPVQLRNKVVVAREGKTQLESLIERSREMVGGEGVVGEQPVIEPGGSFDYAPGCPLTTPTGSMEDRYFMVAADASSFDVAIPKFPLIAPAVTS